MSVTVFGRLRGAYNEERYLALGETSVKTELFDGALVMSPPANIEHQDIAVALKTALSPHLRAAGLRIHLDCGVRLGRDRIAIPDVAVMLPVPRHLSVVDAELVHLVVEITSRGTRRNDRVRKMNYYAEAGIPYYLLIDRCPALVMRLYRPKDEQYIEELSAAEGACLHLPAPFDAVIDPRTFEE